jgi:hypothetical protein
MAAFFQARTAFCAVLSIVLSWWPRNSPAATSVVPQATGSHAGPLSGGSNVYSKETIRTGQSGQADLQFKDNSNLKVGSNSSVHLDKFVYDPNKSTSAVAIQATRGTFRFVTGSQGNGSVQVKTPYGTLGVRG